MDVFCDITTGTCGPAGESNGVMEFVDLSAPKDEKLQERTKNEEDEK